MRSAIRVLVVLCLFSVFPILNFGTLTSFADSTNSNLTGVSYPTLKDNGSQSDLTGVSYPTTRLTGVSYPTLRNGEITGVPTLSEWGIIVMAGLMGIAGLVVTVRRQRVLQSS